MESKLVSLITIEACPVSIGIEVRKARGNTTFVTISNFDNPKLCAASTSPLGTFSIDPLIISATKAPSFNVIETIALVLCQDLAQVKMRNLSSS